MVSSEDRIQVASADTVEEFQRQLNYFYERGYCLLTQSTAPLGDRIIFTAVLEKEPATIHGDPFFEQTIQLVEQEHEYEQENPDEF